jgi:hypothetical protein
MVGRMDGADSSGCDGRIDDWYDGAHVGFLDGLVVTKFVEFLDDCVDG